MHILTLDFFWECMFSVSSLKWHHWLSSRWHPWCWWWWLPSGFSWGHGSHHEWIHWFHVVRAAQKMRGRRWEWKKARHDRTCINKHKLASLNIYWYLQMLFHPVHWICGILSLFQHTVGLSSSFRGCFIGDSLRPSHKSHSYGTTNRIKVFWGWPSDLQTSTLKYLVAIRYWLLLFFFECTNQPTLNGSLSVPFIDFSGGSNTCCDLRGCLVYYFSSASWGCSLCFFFWRSKIGAGIKIADEPYCWCFRNPQQPPFGCIKPCKWWDKLPTSTVAGFLNHQQYGFEITWIMVSAFGMILDVNFGHGIGFECISGSGLNSLYNHSLRSLFPWSSMISAVNI